MSYRGIYLSFMQALQHTLTVDLLPDARVLGDDWDAADLNIVSQTILSWICIVLF